MTVLLASVYKGFSGKVQVERMTDYYGIVGVGDTGYSGGQRYLRNSPSHWISGTIEALVMTVNDLENPSVGHSRLFYYPDPGVDVFVDQCTFLVVEFTLLLQDRVRHIDHSNVDHKRPEY